MKRFIAMLLAAVCFAAPVSAYDTAARSAVLYDCLTNRVIWQENGGEVRGMASTTKIMTALVALELYDPDQVVTVKREWTGIEGSSMYLRPGERLTVRDLLYGLLLQSGNDAATALAGLHSEGTAGFVAAMNEKAVRLGLEHTHFENPSGLDGKEHHTTAEELAILAAAAMEDPDFAAIAGTKSITLAGRYMKNHNRLLFQLPGCIGVKTGYTTACGRCLVSALERDGRRLVAVTLGDRQDWADHTALYEEAFSGMELRELVRAGLYSGLPVMGGVRDSVGLELREGCTLSLTEEERSRVRYEVLGPRFFYAPVSAGQAGGTLRITLDGAVIFESGLYCVDAVDRCPKPTFVQRIKLWWESR